VDDLVISLTIKEGGNLDKLRKQLKTIVGAKGGRIGAGFMFLKKDLITVKRDVKVIKDIVKWLRPTRMPTKQQPKRMRAIAGTLLHDLDEFAEDIVEKILKTPKLKTLKREAGVKTTAELRTVMGASMEGVRETIQDIYDDITDLPPYKVEEAITVLDHLIKESQSDRKIGLKHWRAITKVTPESIYQDKIEDIIKEQGIPFESQKSLYHVKKDALELPEIQKTLDMGLTRWEALLLKQIKFERNDLSRELRDIKDATSNRNLREAFGLTVRDSSDVLSGAIVKALKDPDKVKEIYDKIYKAVYKKPTPEEIEERMGKTVDEELKKDLDRIVKDTYDWTVKATEGADKVDVELEKLGALRKLFGLTIIPLRHKGGVGLEIKKIIEKGDIDQLEKRVKQKYGKSNVALIGEQLTEDAIKRARQKGLEGNVTVLPPLRAMQKFPKELIDASTEEFSEKVADVVQEVAEDEAKALEKNVISATKEFFKTADDNAKARYDKQIKEIKKIGEGPIIGKDFPGDK